MLNSLQRSSQPVQKTQLASEPIRSLFWKMAIPTIVSQVVNLLYTVVDRVFIGHISEDGSLALTGIGLCFPLIMAVSAFALLVGMGGAPRASILLGKKEEEKASQVMGNSFSLVVITAIVLTVLVFSFQRPLLQLFGVSDAVWPYSAAYLEIYIMGTLFVMITLGMNPFITAQGFAKISMYTVLIGAVSNLILDPVLIFGFGLGVRGAAIATVISQAVSAAWVVRFLCSRQGILRLDKRHLRLQPSVFLPSLALGMAPFIMQFTESALNLSFNTSLAKYGGDLAAGTMTILSSVSMLVLMPISGMAQGVTPIIGYNYGAGHFSRVKETFRTLLICSLLFTTFMGALAVFAPGVFAGIFTANPELIRMVEWSLPIFMGAQFLMGAQIACQQTFIALGNAWLSTGMAVLRKLVLLIPLIYLLPAFLENKVFAVFLAEPISDGVAVIATFTIFMAYFRRIEQKEKMMPHEKMDEIRR